MPLGISMLEEFKPATLIGYIKNLPEPESWIGSRFLPNDNIDDVDFEYILGAYQRPVMASILAWDSEAPIAGKKGITKVTGELPPIKRKIHVEEKELIKFFRPRVGTGDRQNAINDIYNYVDEMVMAVRGRMEWLRWKALSTGQVVYDEGGIKFTIDYGCPSALQETLAGNNRWSVVATANPISDLRRWKQDYIDNNGIAPGYMVMSSATQLYLLQNESIRQLITNYTTQYISDAQLAQLLTVFGLPEIVIFDAQIQSEANNGVLSTSRFVAEDLVILLPPSGYNLGKVLVGPTAESIASGIADNSAKQEGVIAQVYETNEPPSVWIKASATAFPTLPGAQLIGIYDVR